MLVAGLVVAHGAPAQRVLGDVHRDLARGGRRTRPRARPARRARRRRCARPGTSSDLVGHRVVAALAAVDRAPQQHLDVGGRRAPRSSMTCVRLSSAELTSKYGFSVVAPISVTRPSSTAGSSASCWALLKRWISSRKKIVGRPPRRRSVGALDHAAHLRLAGVDRAELLERGVGRRGDDPRERRLAGAGRPVEDHRERAPLLDRGAQRAALAEHVLLARRARRACAGACARAAAHRAQPRGPARLRRAGTTDRPSTFSIPAVDLVLYAIWCFLVALAGGLVGLVLGNLRLPATLLVASSAAAGTGANLIASAVAAATASVAHIRARRVDWRLFAWMAPPSIVGGLLGGYVSGVLPRRALLAVISVVLFHAAFELFVRPPAPVARRERARSRAGAAVVTGAVVGFLGGVVGLILGSLRMPAMLRYLRVPARRAAATNVTVGFLVGVVGRDRPPAVRARPTGRSRRSAPRRRSRARCSARGSPGAWPSRSSSARSPGSCWSSRCPPRCRPSRNVSAMQQETTEVLQRLVRFNTVNPPGNEREAQEYLAALPRRTPGSRSSCSARTGAAAEPRRAAARHRRRPDAVPAQPRRHRARDAVGVAARPVVGRRRRRRALGPRRARHEVADRRRGRRRRRRSRARAGAASGDLLVVVVVDEETGGARGRAVDLLRAPRQGPLRLPAQRGRRQPSSRSTASASTASASPRRASSASSCARAASRATRRSRRSATTRC